MPDKTNHDDERTGAVIEPARIDLSHVQQDHAPSARARTPARRFAVVALLALLLLVAAGVIFILPDWTPRPAPSVNPDNQATAAASATVTAAKPAPSPWTEAQMARMRKETQDILADMLKLQDQLEAINVTKWGKQDYQQALKAADNGDAAYRQRDFDLAKKQYEQALAQFKQLLEKSESLYSQSIEEGVQALEQGDSGKASQAFQQAMLIKPDDEEAAKGMKRTGTLDEVFRLMDSGDEHLQAGELGEAKHEFQQALALDPETKLAAQKLEQAEARIVERDFNKAMTAGYSALENNRLQEARSALLQAAKLKPGSEEVKTALNQVDNRITTGRIAALLQQAKSHEQQEEWLDAVQAYDQALALDVSLQQARQGREYAQWRSNLDARLNMAISKPDRLSSMAVYKETQVLLKDAGRIDNPGTRLKRQIAVLNVLLQEAATPVQVTLQSDNETEITVYKVGEMGRFLQKQLNLLPGNYVAVGNREGYRDVRVEFVVDAEKNMQPVIIQCEEKIALGKYSVPHDFIIHRKGKQFKTTSRQTCRSAPWARYSCIRGQDPLLRREIPLVPGQPT